MTTKSLISLNDPKAPASEAYRMIRTNLEYTNIDQQNKIIAFTSPRMKDGKTTTVCNLAVILAHAGDKVLVIDCDLRKPRVHKIFNLPNEAGLTNIIVKNKQLEDVIQQPPGIENVEVITSGPLPPMPSELLSSKTMQEILATVKDQYDVILVDTPPVLSVADATIISRYAQGMILVIAFAKSTVDEVKTSKKALEKVQANVLGTVMTFAEQSKRGYYYNYYYDYTDSGKKG